MVGLCKWPTFHDLPGTRFKLMISVGRLVTNRPQMMQCYLRRFGAHGVTIKGDPGEGDLGYQRMKVRISEPGHLTTSFVFLRTARDARNLSGSFTSKI